MPKDSPRSAFADALYAEMMRRGNLWLLYGDLGYGVLDKIVRDFPGRCVNAGVAEQNMVGVAAGLATTGKTVVVFSITNFVALRPLEQIRNDVCYPNRDVKLVGVGVGEDYGTLGFTHHGVEDETIIRCLPNIRVVTAQTVAQAREAVLDMFLFPGPFYLRLGRGSW